MHKKNVTLSLATELVIQCTLFPTLGGMISNKTVSRYTKDFSTMHDHFTAVSTRCLFCAAMFRNEARIECFKVHTDAHSAPLLTSSQLVTYNKR